MSIENRIGNIFDQPDVNLIVQQCNIRHTFGAGIAKIIRENYPYAYAADLATAKDDKDKIGTFSVGKPDSKVATPKEPFFVNMYSQGGYGNPNRDTIYDAMVTALEKLEKSLSGTPSKYVVGIPYSIGCGLANGNWTIVSAIIRSIFADSPVKVVIVRLPNQALLGEDAKAIAPAGTGSSTPDDTF